MGAARPAALRQPPGTGRSSQDTRHQAGGVTAGARGPAPLGARKPPTNPTAGSRLPRRPQDRKALVLNPRRTGKFGRVCSVYRGPRRTKKTRCPESDLQPRLLALTKATSWLRPLTPHLCVPARTAQVTTSTWQGSRPGPRSSVPSTRREARHGKFSATAGSYCCCSLLLGFTKM